jgi:hypothetical protein
MVHVRTVLLIISLILSASLTHATTCELSTSYIDEIRESAKGIKDAYGSCAFNNLLIEKADWRKNIDNKIAGFVKNPSSPTLSEIFNEFGKNSKNFDQKLTDNLIAANKAFYEVDKIKNDKNFSLYDRDEQIKYRETWRNALTAIKEAQNAIKQAKAAHSNELANNLLKRIQSPETQAKLKDLAKQARCLEDANYVIAPRNGMYNAVNKAELEKSIAKFEKVILNPKDPNAKNSITLCSEIDFANSATVAVAQKETISLEGEQFFLNNKHELTPDALNKLLSQITPMLKSKKPGCERYINTIQISTSASQLANADEIGRWDFKNLSLRRSNYLADQIKKKFKVPDDKIDTDPLGFNGDGTSGLCPYKISGNDAVRDPQVSDEELATARYARIYVEIAEKGSTCDKANEKGETPPHDYYATKCYDIYMECK